MTSQHKDLTSQHKDLTSQHKYLTSQHDYLTSDGRNMPPYPSDTSILTILFASFYHGYCKDQRNVTVITSYVTMDYENREIHLSIWRNVKISVSLKFKSMSITIT